MAQSLINILKPIEEVVGYVMDMTNWNNWGINFNKAENIGIDKIEGHYFYIPFGGPAAEVVTDWLVSPPISGDNQKVTFTATSSTMSTLPIVTYTFTSTEQGASTDVTREANPDDGMSTGLLGRLKTAVEGAA